MSTQEIVAAFLALIGGGVGVKLIDWLRDFWTGRAQQRRADVDKLTATVAAAEAAKAAAEQETEDTKREAAETVRAAEISRDNEATHRRILAEHASELRLILINRFGQTAADLPRFPANPHPPKE